MCSRIYLSLAHMGGGVEQRYIKEAFDTNWVVPLGPNVDAFEKEIAHYLGEKKRVAALSLGAAAIHLGLIQLGVKTVDEVEVICQSFTFAESVNPVKYIGADPVFVDSEKETWNYVL
jgi:dTDP-4-amino-4,6-dideoxygalactose transaminase